MLERLSRLGPLTGVVFSLLAIAGFATAQKPPGAKADGARVVAFYQAHGTSQKVADLLLMLAFAVFLFFAGALRGHLRRIPAAGGLGAVLLAGAAVLTAGAALFFGCDFALASAPADLAPAAAQALNVLALYLVLPVMAGGFVFGVASGLAILRWAPLPRWLGWVAILIGIGIATPALIGALILLFLWTATVGVLVFRRGGVDAHAAGAVVAASG
jgi:hypothetical protein